MLKRELETRREYHRKYDIAHAAQRRERLLKNRKKISAQQVARRKIVWENCPEKAEINRDKAVKHTQKYYWANREKCLRKNRRWNHEHADLCRKRSKQYRVDHPERGKVYGKRYHALHRKEFSVYSKTRMVALLPDSYVRNTLSAGSGRGPRSLIKPSEWPQEMVNLRRQLILIRRKLHELSR